MQLWQKTLAGRVFKCKKSPAGVALMLLDEYFFYVAKYTLCDITLQYKSRMYTHLSYALIYMILCI